MNRRTVTAAWAASLILASATSATATQLVTGAQVQDGTITAADLSPELRRSLDAERRPADYVTDRKIRTLERKMSGVCSWAHSEAGANIGSDWYYTFSSLRSRTCN